jgi:hypothetical protein
VSAGATSSRLPFQRSNPFRTYFRASVGWFPRACRLLSARLRGGPPHLREPVVKYSEKRVPGTGAVCASTRFTNSGSGSRADLPPKLPPDFPGLAPRIPAPGVRARRGRRRQSLLRPRLSPQPSPVLSSNGKGRPAMTRAALWHAYLGMSGPCCTPLLPQQALWDN